MTWQLLTRLRKAAFAAAHPWCWTSLACGVAPAIEHLGVLRGLDCDLVLDVGANRGQFSLMARAVYPGLPIHAYEPQPREAAIYRRILGHRGVELHEIALGEKEGTVHLHVSRHADSSSLLPIGALQSRIFPGTEEQGTIRVEVVPLDSLREHWGHASRALLKLDVQGYELGVLRGARQALGHCAFVYAECSEVPLYDGQCLRTEVERFLAGEGFHHQQAHNQTYHEGKLIQADRLFVRSKQ